MSSTTSPPDVPAWTLPGFLEARAGRLLVGGVDALSLAREHDTPLFVFSEARIRAKVARLNSPSAPLRAGRGSSNIGWIVAPLRQKLVDVAETSLDRTGVDG